MGALLTILALAIALGALDNSIRGDKSFVSSIVKKVEAKSSSHKEFKSRGNP